MLHDDHGSLYTYGDYMQWSGDERWEIVDGRVFDMTPAPSRLHQDVVGQLHLQIARSLQGHPCRVYLAPFDVRLPKGDEPDEEIETVVQPDLSVICDPAKLDDAGCRGAPDWVIEILSPRTSARDRELKRDLYARSGVREYWHLEPGSRQLTRYRLADDANGYEQATAEKAVGATRSLVLARVEIDWAAVFED